MDGQPEPLRMRELRERVEAGEQFDMFDIGGCGCMDDARELAAVGGGS